VRVRGFTSCIGGLALQLLGSTFGLLLDQADAIGRNYALGDDALPLFFVGLSQ